MLRHAPSHHDAPLRKECHNMKLAAVDIPHDDDEPPAPVPPTRSEYMRICILSVLFLGGCTLFLQVYQTTSVAIMHRGLVAAPAPESTSTETPAPTSSPTPTPAPTRPTDCFAERDYGLISALVQHRQTFCHDPHQQQTPLTIYDGGEGSNMRALVFDNGQFALDMHRARVSHPIANISLDGGNHDPRYAFQAHHIQCQCHALYDYAVTNHHQKLRLWEYAFGDYPADKQNDSESTLCYHPNKTLTFPIASPDKVEYINNKAILIPRRDDHNPFFQIAAAYNAWIMMKVLGWNRQFETIRVIHLDGGYPAATDILQHRMLASSSKPILSAGSAQWTNKTIVFTKPVLLPPFETSGPMMQHLDDREPCGKSQLLLDFRQDAFHAMNVSVSTAYNATLFASLRESMAPDAEVGFPEQQQFNTTRAVDRIDDNQSIVVTVISRRDYQGRRVQRHWLNEDEILTKLRTEYPNVHFQSIDFVRIPLEMQMQVILQSHVIIGMHGAGMVNVLWSQPETMVVEIFPKRRKRWGYRNLCQWIGCQWHEFRGGKDTGKGDNASDKRIPYDEWIAFFDPLMHQVLQARQAAN